MAAVKPVGKPGLEEDTAPVHRIRITLTSRNVKNLEKGAPPCPHASVLECLWATSFGVCPLCVTCRVQC